MAPPRTQPEFCTVDGCENPPSSRGLCRTHYSRWRRHGDPGVVLRDMSRRLPRFAEAVPWWRTTASTVGTLCPWCGGGGSDGGVEGICFRHWCRRYEDDRKEWVRTLDVDMSAGPPRPWEVEGIDRSTYYKRLKRAAAARDA